jgi:hypothetical protein
VEPELYRGDEHELAMCMGSKEVGRQLFHAFKLFIRVVPASMYSVMCLFLVVAANCT